MWNTLKRFISFGVGGCLSMALWGAVTGTLIGAAMVQATQVKGGAHLKSGEIFIIAFFIALFLAVLSFFLFGIAGVVSSGRQGWRDFQIIVRYNIITSLIMLLVSGLIGGLLILLSGRMIPGGPSLRTQGRADFMGGFFLGSIEGLVLGICIGVLRSILTLREP